MAIGDWNWRLAADVQDYPWDCAAASLAWCLNTIGLNYSEDEVIAGLGPSRISPTYGLLDASGAGLVSWLAEIGIGASNNPDASWSEVTAAAGFQPMLMGGRAWYHWVAVRMGGPAIGHPEVAALALMNPAPGWMGVDQVLYESDYPYLGPFSVVWFTSW